MHEFDSKTPIYLQLVEDFKLQIISGALAAGERIPSVRELALAMQVNPNTMQKALSELEETGLLYTERTNGRFVTKDEALIREHRERYADELCLRFLASMERIGYPQQDAIRALNTKKGTRT